MDRHLLTLTIISSQLVISKIPKAVSTYSIDVHDNVVKSFDSRQLDNFLVAHTHVEEVFALPPTSAVTRQCKGRICCEFSMRYHQAYVDDSKNRLAYNYKLTIEAPSSKQIAAGTGSKDFICALVACTSDRAQSCGKRFTNNRDDRRVEESSLKFTDIRIKMIVEVETSVHDYLIMPTNLNNALLPFDVGNFKFTRSSTFTANRWVNAHNSHRL